MALKILLADDNITAQKMGSKILTDAGYQVVAVSNGAAAMKKIASEKPELLILDVYMPGYNGLEVCQKVKSAPETAALPVILTVTNMEPFNPEDGNKVRADGVMIKPFEASDLLAIVQKFERKLQPPEPPKAEEPDYEKTVKMAAMGFQDASYEEWKAEAAPEEPEAQRVAVPQEMASAPALGMEDMLAEAPAEAAPTEAPAPFLDLEAAPAAPSFAEAAPAPDVEFTSAPHVGEIGIGTAPELELTGQPAAAVEVPIARDPALVTDAAEMAQFVTKFGDAPSQPSFTPAEEIPPAAEQLAPAAEEVAAAAVPEITEVVETAPAVSLQAPVEEVLVEETVPAVEPAPLPQVPPEPETVSVSLEEEMRRAFNAGGGAAAAPALAPEPEPVPEPELVAEAVPFVDVPPAPVVEPPPPPPPAAVVPDRLVEQFAAELARVAPTEVSAEEVAPPEPVAEAAPPAPEPAPAAALDEQRVGEAVQRVMSRYKDELVAAIVRELKS